MLLYLRIPAAQRPKQAKGRKMKKSNADATGLMIFLAMIGLALLASALAGGM